MSTSTVPAEGPSIWGRGKASHAEYAAGLRRLADMIDRLDESVRIAYLDAPHVWNPTDADQVALIIRAGLAAGAEIVKYGTEDSSYRNVGIKFGAVEALALISKATVCERVVVGTETINVPDPTYIPPSTPMIERTVDKVEWRCRPLLAGEGVLTVDTEADRSLSELVRATGSELAAKTSEHQRLGTESSSDALIRTAANASGVLHTLAVALEGATWTIGDDR